MYKYSSSKQYLNSILFLLGKVVNPRHYTGLENKGEYLHMAQVLAIENRIPTSHCSDTPTKRAHEVNYYPSAEDIKLIADWCKFSISRAIIDYFPAFKNCKKYSRLN